MTDELYAAVDVFDEFPVLDRGFVRMENWMGDDVTVVNSARVSFGKRIDPSQPLSDADKGLIRYLMENRHGTPFEHNAFTFHVKAPIFVFREWQRHRIGSFNEMSGRYMELPEEWYVPLPDYVRIRVGKPGHYTYEPAPMEDAWAFIKTLEIVCGQSYEAYSDSLQRGIAPEQARMCLHVNHYSEMYWTVNARSLMNFLSLRNASTAQWEIRQYAEVIEYIWQHCMPVTADAFVATGRVAP